MNHSELHLIDLITMVSVGVYCVRRVKNTGDYYVAGRSLGPMELMATVCATIIGGSGLMGRAGVAYSSGTKAILTAVPYLLGMFLFAGYSGRISDIGREYGITSIPDLFERRFGKAAKLILAAMVAFTMMGTVASQVTATATIINMLGGNLGFSQARNGRENRNAAVPAVLRVPQRGRPHHRPVYQECLQHPDVRLELLCGGSWPTGLCGAVLEEGHHPRHHRRHGGRLRGLRGLEAGRCALRSRLRRARRHRLRHRPAGGKPSDLQKASFGVSESPQGASSRGFGRINIGALSVVEGAPFLFPISLE